MERVNAPIKQKLKDFLEYMPFLGICYNLSQSAAHYLILLNSCGYQYVVSELN